MTDMIKRPDDRPKNIFEDLLDDDFSNLFSLVPRRMFGRPEVFRKMEWHPRIDVKETEESLVFIAEMPGMNQKDIEVTIENSVLTLKGERKFESEEEKENYHRVERQYGCFQRSFSLPNNIDGESAKASYKDGLLEIAFQKREEAKPKKINIDLT